MGKRKIEIPDFGGVLLQNINRMRMEMCHCDFTIRAGNEEIPVHKIIIAANSDYFKAMLLHDNIETQSGQVEMKEVDVNCLKQCIEFMYTGKCVLDDEEIEGMMFVAQLLQLDDLCQQLMQNLESELNMTSFFLTKHLSNLYNWKQLEKSCDKFAVENFEGISSLENFKFLEKKYISYLLKSKENKASDGLKLQALINWAKHDDQRKSVFESLFGMIDLCKIPLEFRRFISENELPVKQSLKCMEKLMKSIFESINVKPKTMRDETPPIEEINMNNCIAIFDKASDHLLLYNPLRSRWKKAKAMNQSMMDSEFTAVILNNHLYVFLSNTFVYRISLEEEMAAWEHLPHKTLDYGPAVVLNGYIYTVEFIKPSTAVERYNPAQNSWEEVQNKNVRCSRSTLVSARGCLYCLGGFFNMSALKMVEVLDPSKSSWSTVRPMNEPRCDSCAVATGDKIFVLGGFSSQSEHSLDTVECYDIDLNTWTTIFTMKVPRCYFSACLIGREIFAVGGDESSPMTIEALSLDKKTSIVVEVLRDFDIRRLASVPVEV